MGEESEMAGANCKRFLQNKLGDRKRRRPNSVHLEPLEIVDERVVGDSTNRLRQTATRQSTQRHLITTGNNTILAKSNKKDIRIQTIGSKKFLRSRKSDNEQLSDHEDIQKQCSTEYGKIDNGNSTLYLTSCNDHGFEDTDNEDENYEMHTNLKEKTFEENEITENSDNDDECLHFEDNKNDESREIGINLEMNNEIENQNTSYDCSSRISIRTPSLLDLNENSQVPSSSNNATKLESEYNKDLGNVVFENNDKFSIAKKCIEEVDIQNTKNDNDMNNKTKTDITLLMDFQDKIGDGDERLSPLQIQSETYQNENICRQISNFSSKINNQQQDEYENNINNNSSICSENGTSSEDPSCNTSKENINKEFPGNEIDKPLEEIVLSEQNEQNQKHIIKSTNVAMISSSLNSTKHLQNTMNINISTDSLRDEPCHYNVDENKGCVTETPPNLPPINITSQETSNFPNAVNLKINDSEIQEESMENESCCQTNTSSPDTNKNMIQETDTSIISDPKSPNINANDENNDNENHPTITDHKRQISTDTEKADKNLQDSLKNQQEDGNQQEQNCDKALYLEKTSSGHGTEFETQQSDRITHQQQQQQLEKDIIDAADKVYTQIEEQYHHQEITSLSSTYGQILSNHQQQHQQSSQDQEDSLQRHDVAIHPQQLQPPLQHPMQQQQNHYSAEQLYQLQQQQEHHHQQLQMHQHHMQKQEVMHQQQHNLARNHNEDHRQQHSHIMDFLHPQHHHPNSSNTQSPLHQQQQQQIHEVYHDLMMDEFHEEHNTPYKL